MNDRQRNVIVGIDIGTTKICTIVGEYSWVGKHTIPRLKIIGVGNVPSFGLKKGMIVNIEKTILSIKNSIREAKRATRFEINEAYISVAGNHIGSFNNRAEVTLKGGAIHSRDVERVLEVAKAITIPEDRRILHIMPQDFIVDGIGGIREPIGMSGSKIEANVHVVTGNISALQNLSKCVEDAGITVKNIILQPLASSVAILNEEEKKLGVAILDIGGGTSDFAVWKKGSLICSQSIPIGGNHFTNDLAVALNTAHGEAEKIKINYGSVIADRAHKDSHISVFGISGGPLREIPQSFVVKVIGCRAEELFQVITKIIEEKKLRKDMVAGLVLTGGGARVKGLATLAEFILGIPVKIGGPLHLREAEGLIQHPEFSTAIGLLMVAFRQEMDERNKMEKGHMDLVNKINQSLKNIFKEIF
ncbi:MAG: cell division protein FtsA [Oligoflexia bacterium]|nr:cell division protein FtsA [Oligoflexia bacterium]